MKWLNQRRIRSYQMHETCWKSLLMRLWRVMKRYWMAPTALQVREQMKVPGRRERKEGRSVTLMHRNQGKKNMTEFCGGKL